MQSFMYQSLRLMFEWDTIVVLEKFREHAAPQRIVPNLFTFQGLIFRAEWRGGDVVKVDVSKGNDIKQALEPYAKDGGYECGCIALYLMPMDVFTVYPHVLEAAAVYANIERTVEKPEGLKTFHLDSISYQRGFNGVMLTFSVGKGYEHVYVTDIYDSDALKPTLLSLPVVALTVLDASDKSPAYSDEPCVLKLNFNTDVLCASKALIKASAKPKIELVALLETPIFSHATKESEGEVLPSLWEGFGLSGLCQNSNTFRSIEALMSSVADGECEVRDANGDKLEHLSSMYRMSLGTPIYVISDGSATLWKRGHIGFAFSSNFMSTI